VIVRNAKSLEGHRELLALPTRREPRRPDLSLSVPRPLRSPTPADLDALARAVAPLVAEERVAHVVERLKDWPAVSGAKALRGHWAGHYRERTGDWRVIFRIVTPPLIVVRIKHRREVYDD
jgi:mRNA-degrading endonuclease RelE of RelBE toxin-antitoxin system